MNHSYTSNGYRDIGLNTMDMENTKEWQFLSTNTSENTVRKNKHMNEPYITVFSAPEPKAQVHY